MVAFILLLFWSGFIILISLAVFVDYKAYFYFSMIILYYTYYFNTLKSIKMTWKPTILLLTIPSLIYWYVIFTHNYYFCIYPFSDEFVISLMFIYFYMFIYVFSEFTH